MRKTLPVLGLSSDLVYHGIGREIFVAPLASNTAPFLQGYQLQLQHYDNTAADLFAWFRNRWLLPRASRDDRYRTYDPEEYRIWRP